MIFNFGVVVFCVENDFLYGEVNFLCGEVDIFYLWGSGFFVLKVDFSVWGSGFSMCGEVDFLCGEGFLWMQGVDCALWKQVSITPPCKCIPKVRVLPRRVRVHQVQRGGKPASSFHQHLSCRQKG